MKLLISAPLASRLATGNRQTLAHCWRWKLRDGLILTQIDHDVDKTIALGLFIDGPYTASPSGTPASSRQAVDLQGDGMSIEGLIDVGAFPHLGPRETDLRAKRFAGAEFWHFSYDWLNEDGIIPHSTGTIGNITILRGAYVAEVRRLTSYYGNAIGEPYLGECPAQFGGPRCKVRRLAPVWTAAATVSERLAQDEAGVVVGDASLAPFAKTTVVRPTVFMGREFWCTVAGTTHATTEPVWPTAIDATIADNTATWKAVQARRWEGRVTTVTNQRTLIFAEAKHTSELGLALMTTPTNVFAPNDHLAVAGDSFYFDADGIEASTRVASGGGSLTLAEPYRGTIPVGLAPSTTLQTATIATAIDAPDDWFGAGTIEFRTGDNRIYPVEVDTWDLGTATLTLQYGLPFTILVGEQATLFAGCRNRREDCRDKWENIHNGRGEWDVPTRLVVFIDARQAS